MPSTQKYPNGIQIGGEVKKGGGLLRYMYILNAVNSTGNYKQMAKKKIKSKAIPITGRGGL
jgi:hypothetical protein